ncbi:Rieske (2Fe-2S) protein [Brumimicrobium aurantiacum]|uniref:Rieske (2Fe-2S) protein n=1 Tax=Brumimicrobium aurantiacum TaxID=1737063 RepID=A0A3E1F1L7_9FLAO|nr:Rieske (2Fe-2S) protein [Brumimicrobium aurantiacum]RFC55706.1 Rieske (2Fe-2S) protein [Brumimicrobium aurantiacum]
MFSDKTRKYRLADSREAFLNNFNAHGEYIQNFPFGEVLFVKKEDEIYAFINDCPHQGQKMQGCSIENGKVICPVHQYKFDIETGRGHGLFLDFYPLEENENGFFLLRTYFSWFGE